MCEVVSRDFARVRFHGVVYQDPMSDAAGRMHRACEAGTGRAANLHELIDVGTGLLYSDFTDHEIQARAR